MSNHFFVAIGFGVVHESFLHQLQLMNQEHQENTDQQRNERGVKRNAQALSNAGNIAFYGLVGLRQRLADTTHCADKADGRNCPRYISNHCELGLEALGFRAVGRDFPVFLHPDTHEEHALARLERKVGPGYRGFTTDFAPTVTLEQDLARRDLTVNAMARAADGRAVMRFQRRPKNGLPPR